MECCQHCRQETGGRDWGWGQALAWLRPVAAWSRPMPLTKAPSIPDIKTAIIHTELKSPQCYLRGEKCGCIMSVCRGIYNLCPHPGLAGCDICIVMVSQSRGCPGPPWLRPRLPPPKSGCCCSSLRLRRCWLRLRWLWLRRGRVEIRQWPGPHPGTWGHRAMSVHIGLPCVGQVVRCDSVSALRDFIWQL